MGVGALDQVTPGDKPDKAFVRKTHEFIEKTITKMAEEKSGGENATTSSGHPVVVSGSNNTVNISFNNDTNAFKEYMATNREITASVLTETVKGGVEICKEFLKNESQKDKYNLIDAGRRDAVAEINEIIGEAREAFIKDLKTTLAAERISFYREQEEKSQLKTHKKPGPKPGSTRKRRK